MRLVKEYLHCDKGDICETAEELGLTDDQTGAIIGALYEVEFLVDADTGTIFAVNGKILDTAQAYTGPDIPVSRS